MKKVLPLLLLLLITLSAVAFAERGAVAYFNSNSYSVVIYTENGYTCGEVTMFKSGLWELERGTIIAGDLSSFGIHNVYDITNNRDITIWIDNFWMSEDQAINWIQNH